MTCDRCVDIHRAQREGKSNQSCHCDCHCCTTSNTHPLFCTCNSTNTTGCSMHGFQVQWNTSNSETIDVS